MLTVKRTKVNVNSGFDQRLTGRARGVVVGATTPALAGTPTLPISYLPAPEKGKSREY